MRNEKVLRMTPEVRAVYDAAYERVSGLTLEEVGTVALKHKAKIEAIKAEVAAEIAILEARQQAAEDVYFERVLVKQKENLEAGRDINSGVDVSTETSRIHISNRRSAKVENAESYCNWLVLNKAYAMVKGPNVSQIDDFGADKDPSKMPDGIIVTERPYVKIETKRKAKAVTVVAKEAPSIESKLSKDELDD